MKTYTPKSQNNNSKYLISAFFVISFILIGLAYADVLPISRSYLHIGVIFMLTFAILFWCRYILTYFTYSLEEDRSGLFNLIIYQTQGKRTSAMCACPLKGGITLEKLSGEALESAKSRKVKGLRRFNFTVTLMPKEAWLLCAADAKGGRIEILLELSEEFAVEVINAADFSQKKAQELYNEDEDEDEYTGDNLTPPDDSE